MYVRTYVRMCCQFPLAGYCSGTARARGLIFSHIVGPVQPFVVLKFGARAAFGSPWRVHLCRLLAPASADDTARDLRSDCSLPFLSGFLTKAGFPQKA